MHPASSPLDSVAADCLEKNEGLLDKAVKFVDWTNKRNNSLTSKFAVNEQEDDDEDDEDSQSSLNDRTIRDFLRGA